MNQPTSINTFSIVGFDPKTEELGIAVASKFLAVGAVVPYANAGVGAVATQSWANLSYGKDGLALLESGLNPDEVIAQMTAKDEKKAFRQVGIVDAKGNSATFTGEDCHRWAGGEAGENFAVQGNILVDGQTVAEMKDVFLKTDGTLAERLLAALAAGESAGGDSRGKQSAALLVVKENGSYGGFNDRYLDLRVDDHKEPVKELMRLFQLHQLYFNKTAEKDILKIDGRLKESLADALLTLEYLKTKDYTEKDFSEALRTYHLVENFDERVQPEGLIDKMVVDYMTHIASEVIRAK